MGGNNVPQIIPPPIAVDAAKITVIMPENARLFVNNQFTSDFGPNPRLFVTPSLRPGTEYYYNMRIEVVDRNGQVGGETRQVFVRSGQILTVNFLPPPPPPPVTARGPQGF
jgi:uncharacterized protein (TIGR03000 family)